MILKALLLLFSVIIYIHNFFPIPKKHINFPNDPPQSDKILYRPLYNKTVLIVIDALRWDFASETYMPKTVQLVQRRGCLSKITVETPTVTLPRLKALTSGMVPQFVDVIYNLAGGKALPDSWLHSAKNNNLTLVFYGDNTWLKLFPDFDRFEGTTSFFVWDFEEVDYNVTRNVHKEMNADWDVMILHYLGLDHIGHVLGPFSDKVGPKLREMDDVVADIYMQFPESLILVTGDHGMRDAGGHGGSTTAETTVPLLTINHPCLPSTFPQTDIPANLAALLGLNIPTTSIGLIQPQFLNLPPPHLLYILRYNCEILLHKGECQRREDGSEEDKYKKCAEDIVGGLKEERRVEGLFVVVVLLVNLLVPQPLWVLWVIVTVGLWVVGEWVVFALLSVCLVFNLYKSKWRTFTFDFLKVASLVHPVTFISSSYIEEEHYYITFCTVTAILIELVRSKEPRWLVTLVLIRLAMDVNATLENVVPRDDNWDNILKKPENQVWQSLIVGGSLLATYFLMKKMSITHKFLLGVTLTLLFIQKHHHSIYLARLIWFIIPLHLDLSMMWTLSLLLLLRPHNLPLLPGALYLTKQSQDPLLLYFLAKTLYFLQGHRNSLSNLDISVAYVGLQDYSWLVYLQMFVHTYGFPVLFLKNVTKDSVKLLLELQIWIMLWMSIVMIVFREHLFVWSVFAPKFFIEGAHSVVTVLAVVCNKIIDKYVV